MNFHAADAKLMTPFTLILITIYIFTRSRKQRIQFTLRSQKLLINCSINHRFFGIVYLKRVSFLFTRVHGLNRFSPKPGSV